MPTSATGTSEPTSRAPCLAGGPGRPTAPAPRTQGFTLLEVLVVVLIIGIVLGIAVISLPGDGDEALRTEARRLDALLDLASEDAIVGNREIALEIQPHGYRFLVQDDEAWRPIETPPLQPRALPDEIRLTVRVDGVRLRLGTDEDDEVGRLYILSSGEMTPFELTLSRRDGANAYRIVTEIDGRHRLEATGP